MRYRCPTDGLLLSALTGANGGLACPVCGGPVTPEAQTSHPDQEPIVSVQAVYSAVDGRRHLHLSLIARRSGQAVYRHPTTSCGLVIDWRIDPWGPDVLSCFGCEPAGEAVLRMARTSLGLDDR